MSKLEQELEMKEKQVSFCKRNAEMLETELMS